jgi:hypothetical protein
VFFLFLIALIIGSIFLIKYLLKKNKKNNTVHSLEKKELEIIICKNVSLKTPQLNTIVGLAPKNLIHQTKNYLYLQLLMKLILT